MAELSLWLDYYDDIYSDFDSRNYLKRRISDDFIFELRNAMKDMKNKFTDIVLLLPEEKRDRLNEKNLSESLKNYFIAQFRIQSDYCRHKFNQGILFGAAGILLMIMNSIISYQGINTLPVIVLRVLMEPAGWFLLWASFDSLFYEWKEMRKESKFYRDLAEVNIQFRSS